MAVSLTVPEYKLIITARKYLDSEELPWCPHWLFTKVRNDERTALKPLTPLLDLDKALQKLVKKKLAKILWNDRYYLNVEATQYIK